MSTPFQNRLVGTIIVAAVVIIFLPDVLDGEKQSHQADFEAIPQAEVFSGKLTNKPFPEDKLVHQKVTPISNETAIDDIATENLPQGSSQQTEKIKVKVPSTKAIVKPPVRIAKKSVANLPEKAIAKEAWVIHLGSFKDKDNVAQLLKKLKSKGYIAFTKPIKTKQGTLTKVIIGPELIKSAMIKKLPALKKLTNIQGKVAYFEPNK
ncbi:SPOR domain-containing protein [Colwellia psychrerythraea]|uniref:Sporulation domain-containing protein n=1 Tax=Colwellia psychrerythraea TaxID=28229 RepID=A0A099L1P1_COLPS|nr:SPOR domain-containing protein [Colwellia psychrerythraea]KGJ96365.1 Sporulation domain-containing protein [Colwellia psychrerythraea]